MGAFELRPNMLLGVSSSATQVEGGELDHTWTDWCRKGNIKDGSLPPWPPVIGSAGMRTRCLCAPWGSYLPL